MTTVRSRTRIAGAAPHRRASLAALAHAPRAPQASLRAAGGAHPLVLGARSCSIEVPRG